MILSRVLLTFLGLAIAFLAYQVFYFQDESLYFWFIPLVLSIIFVFAFKPQIDYFFYKLRKPRLPREIKNVLKRFDPFYQRLQGSVKEEFEIRLQLYLLSKEFISTTESKISEDVKALIASQHIKLCLGHKKYLYQEYERIALYPHPFLSPKYEDIAHVSETEHDDGLILLSMDHAMKSLVQPGTFFNLSLYEFAQAFIKLHPTLFSKSTEVDDETLIACNYWNKEDIRKQIGLPVLNYSAVGLVLYFEKSKIFKEHNPELYNRYFKILKIDHENLRIL